MLDTILNAYVVLLQGYAYAEYAVQPPFIRDLWLTFIARLFAIFVIPIVFVNGIGAYAEKKGLSRKKKWIVMSMIAACYFFVLFVIIWFLVPTK